MNKKNFAKLALPTTFAIGVMILLGAGCFPKKPPVVSEPMPTKPVDKIEKKWDLDCEVGSFWTSGGIKYQITGIEKHVIGGKSVDVCCSEVSEGGKTKLKSCTDASGDYSLNWDTDEETGKFYKILESYKQNEQRCIKYFDLDENVTGEFCS